MLGRTTNWRKADASWVKYNWTVPLTGELCSRLYRGECVYGCECPECVWECLHAVRNGQRRRLRTRLSRVWGWRDGRTWVKWWCSAVAVWPRGTRGLNYVLWLFQQSERDINKRSVRHNISHYVLVIWVFSWCVIVKLKNLVSAFKISDWTNQNLHQLTSPTALTTGKCRRPMVLNRLNTWEMRVLGDTV